MVRGYPDKMGSSLGFVPQEVLWVSIQLQKIGQCHQFLDELIYLLNLNCLADQHFFSFALVGETTRLKLLKQYDKNIFYDVYLIQKRDNLAVYCITVSAVEQLQVMASKRQYKEAGAQLEVIYNCIEVLHPILYSNNK